MGHARQALQPDGRQFRPELSAHGRQGHVHPDAVGDRRAEAMGYRQGAAKKPRRPRACPGGVQSMGPGNGPAVVPAEPDRRRLGGGLTMHVRLRPVATAVLLGVAAIPGLAHAQDIGAPQRMLVERYVAAITAHDAAALKALYHPATRACMNAENADFFEFLFSSDLRFESDLKEGYKLTGFDTADPSIVEGNAMGGMLPQPVAPTHQFQIDTMGTRVVTIVHLAAEKDGTWFIIAGCPTEKGLAMFRERRGQGAQQQAQTRDLVSKLGEPLLSEIKELLAQNRRIDAIKRYQDAAKVDL